MTAPERIWAWEGLNGGLYWSPEDPGSDEQPYVRADLLTAERAAREAAEAERDTFADCLRVVCHHLQLPQSESGPADDSSLYDKALQATDLLLRETEAERVRHATARWAAEAEVAQLRAALTTTPEGDSQ